MNREYITLNKCPLCGSDVSIWSLGFGIDKEYVIYCDNDHCGLSYGRSFGYDFEEVADVWNSATASKESEDE